MRLNKEGYAEFAQEISTLDEGRQTILAQMKPLIEKDIIVRVVDPEGSVRDLSDDEEVSVQFNLIDKQFGGFKDQRAAVLDGKEKKKLNVLLYASLSTSQSMLFSFFCTIMVT